MPRRDLRPMSTRWRLVLGRIVSPVGSGRIGVGRRGDGRLCRRTVRRYGRPFRRLKLGRDLGGMARGGPAPAEPEEERRPPGGLRDRPVVEPGRCTEYGRPTPDPAAGLLA